MPLLDSRFGATIISVRRVFVRSKQRLEPGALTGCVD
jgi:hypothetical protein